MSNTKNSIYFKVLGNKEYTQISQTKSLLNTVYGLLITACVFSTSQVQAQQTNSPLSYLGVGEVYSGGTAVNSMMGGAGVTSANGIYINTLNPAMLARNRYTVFEMGAQPHLAEQLPLLCWHYQLHPAGHSLWAYHHIVR
jgi:hypothetical protein